MKRIISGDRPTGALHVGHYIGSIKNRVKLQEENDMILFIADLHMLTTKPTRDDILKVRDNMREMVLDYLGCGIDPEKATIYLQSGVPAVYELNLFFENLVGVNHLLDLPSIKEMAKNAHMSAEQIPFGLLGYPVLQAADILLPRAQCVPVGKDNAPHVEIARDIASRFNSIYGEVFPLPELMLSETPTLVGTDGKGKMSKSAGNSILLSDDAKAVEKKVKGMFTDPNRLRADMPGTVEGNPVFIYHDVFNPNQGEIDDLKERYRKGTVGDVEVKEKLTIAMNRYLDPFRERRERYAKEKGLVEEIIYKGTNRMNEIAAETMEAVHQAMGVAGTWKKISKIARERAKNAL